MDAFPRTFEPNVFVLRYLNEHGEEMKQIRQQVFDAITRLETMKFQDIKGDSACTDVYIEVEYNEILYNEVADELAQVGWKTGLVQGELNGVEGLYLKVGLPLRNLQPVEKEKLNPDNSIISTSEGIVARESKPPFVMAKQTTNNKHPFQKYVRKKHTKVWQPPSDRDLSSATRSASVATPQVDLHQRRDGGREVHMLRNTESGQTYELNFRPWERSTDATFF